MGATPGAAASLSGGHATRMKSLSFSSSRRVSTWLWTSLTVAWLAAGCDNPGGVGDGNYDDSIWPGGATSTSTAGKSNSGHAGTSNASGGASGQSGIAGRAGMSGVSGSAGASGSGGASGAIGTAGSAGAVVGTGGSNSTGGMGSGGLTGTGGKGGSGAGGSGTTGGTGPLICGNGKIDSGETCDDGPPGGSSAGTGGTGGGSGGGEEMGGGTGPVVALYGQKCSNTCYKVGNQACLDCEFAGDCYESVNNCLGPEGMAFTAAQQSACFAVMKCIQTSNCLDGTGTLGKCYCGSLSTLACGSAPFIGAGSPDGLCVNEIKAGFPTLTSNSAVLGALKEFTLPSGAAMKRLNCQKENVDGEGHTCSDVCGFTSGGPAFP
jgi:hypothetical protein